jgi:geranylgeranylglycerol-phosphate geranylgeranyltransferase
MSALVGPPQPTSLIYVWRSILYASLSAIALYCGYFLGDQGRHDNGQVLLVGFFVACLPFFVAYSAVFPRNREVRTPHEPRSIFVLVTIFSVVAAYAVILKYDITTGHDLSLADLINFVPIIFIFWLYGAYLLWRFDRPITPLARHQLVWSVMLAIGVMLYVGILFRTIETAFHPITPIVIISSAIVLSEIFHVGRYTTLWISMAHGALAILVSFLWDQLASDIRLMFGCGGVAAYLAVFESWSVTSEEAISAGRVELGQGTIVGRYYNATLLALIISAMMLPMLYPFTSLSPWFLVLVATHSTIALLLWFTAAQNNRLVSWPWKLLRITLGSSFLIALAADSRLFSKISLPILPLPKSTLLYTLLAAASALVLFRLPEVLRDWQDRGIAGLLSSPSRFVGVIFYLAAFGVGSTIAIYTSPDYPPPMIARATYSCLIYFTFWITSGVYIIQTSSPRPPSGIGASLLAILSVTRVATSLLIGGAMVFLGLFNGETLTSAVARSLPLTLVAMGGFSLNDSADALRDRINRPYRPVPAGLIGPQSARKLGLCLLLIASVLALSILKSPREIAIVGIGLVGTAVYNVIVARASYLKNVWTGALCSLPIIWFTENYSVSYLMVIAVFAYISGRELLMDVVDIRGDMAAGVFTIPCRIGVKQASVIGYGFVLGGAVLFQLLVKSSIISAAMMAVIALSIVRWIAGDEKSRVTTIYLLWMPMLLGVVALGTAINTLDR